MSQAGSGRLKVAFVLAAAAAALNGSGLSMSVRMLSVDGLTVSSSMHSVTVSRSISVRRDW